MSDCKNCKHYTKETTVYPCKECSRMYMDYYDGGEGREDCYISASMKEDDMQISISGSKKEVFECLYYVTKEISKSFGVGFDTLAERLKTTHNIDVDRFEDTIAELNGSLQK